MQISAHPLIQCNPTSNIDSDNYAKKKIPMIDYVSRMRKKKTLTIIYLKNGMVFLPADGIPCYSF